VQALLALQLTTALVAGWHSIVSIHSVFAAAKIIPVLVAYAIPFFTLNLLLPAYREAKEGRLNKTKLQRLKHNHEIFEALLVKQKSITENSKRLGILLGKPNASYQIIKVCNPYCGPCAKAHEPLERLLHNNNDLQLQIIFTATNNDGDITAPPVKHLLAIAEENVEEYTKKVLHNWYLPDKKNYDVFAQTHPFNGALDKQNDKLYAMTEWCKKVGITFTPTFFVSMHSSGQEIQDRIFYQLPEIYNVEDLAYFLTV
jgi:hypothetical protein